LIGVLVLGELRTLSVASGLFGSVLGGGLAALLTLELEICGCFGGGRRLLQRHGIPLGRGLAM
jgi:hypothetical protein